MVIRGKKDIRVVEGFGAGVLLGLLRAVIEDDPNPLAAALTQGIALGAAQAPHRIADRRRAAARNTKIATQLDAFRARVAAAAQQPAMLAFR